MTYYLVGYIIAALSVMFSIHRGTLPVKRLPQEEFVRVMCMLPIVLLAYPAFVLMAVVILLTERDV